LAVRRFSESTKETVSRIIPGQYAWEKVAHGIANAQPSGRALPDLPPPCGDRPLRVAFLGYVPPHKGSLIIEQAIKHRRLSCGAALEWHVIGKLFLDAGDKVVQHGEYQRRELLEKIKAAAPHLVAILSICPETYCLTLDEAWNAGVPVIVSPLGAPPERMLESGAGWVLEDMSEGGFLKLLDEIASDWPVYLRARNNISKTRIYSVQEEVERYRGLYQQCFDRAAPADAGALFHFLQKVSVLRPREHSRGMQLAGRIAGRVVYYLDALHVRGCVQKWAYRLLPRRVLDALKRAR
jgi:hypothetical protein